MQAKEHNRTNILKEMKKTYIKPTVKILYTDSEGIMADAVSGTAVGSYNGEDSDIDGTIGTESGDDNSSVYHTKGSDLWDDWEDDDLPL